MSCVFQEREDCLEVDLYDTGALRTEEVSNVPATSTFVLTNLETRLGSVHPCLNFNRARVSKNRGQMYWIDWVKHQQEVPFIPDEDWDQLIDVDADYDQERTTSR